MFVLDLSDIGIRIYITFIVAYKWRIYREMKFSKDFVSEYHELTQYQRNYLKIKSIIDTVIASAGLLLLSPAFLGITIAIKLEDGWKAPVFFKQKRVGINKTHFNLYKFRSMRLDAPHDTPTHLFDNPEQFITKVGKFLRKTSLDELPQLWNIVQPGHPLGVCGPRPALYNQDDLIAERDKYGIYQVKPGLTGWAQIHGRDELEIDEKARLDGYYLKYFGTIIDLKCFFGTFLAVLRSDGVIEGGTVKCYRMVQEVRNK